MQRKLHIVLSATLFFLGFSVAPAQAVFPPNKPTSVVATSNASNNSRVESATVTVAWNASVVDSTHDLPRSYEVRFVSGAVTKRFPVSRTAAASYTGTFSGGLLGGTTYSVTVAALPTEGSEAVSDAQNITPVTSPDIPGSRSTDTARQSITLNWAAPSNTGGSAITGFLIRNIDSGETQTVSNPALTSQTIGNQIPGSTVSYQIAAINRNGIGAFGDFDDTVIPAPPTAPAKPDLTKSQTSVTASWVAVTATSPVTGYKVYLRDLSKALPETATLTTSTTITFDSLTAGASYTVRVLATNLAGDSPLSETSTTQTLPNASVLTTNTITFSPDPLPDLVIGGDTTVTVTAISGTPTVALTATPVGACTWNNTSNVVTAVAVGTCTLTATIAQEGQYAQGVLSKTFTVTKTLQTITFNPIANQPLPGPLTLSARSTSGLTVTFTATDNCTVSGVTLSFTTTGSCTVDADQAGNNTYQAANSVRRTFTITAASTTTNPGGGNTGGGSSGGGGGGGGGGVGTTWFNLFLADPENLSAAYAGTGCATFTLKSKEGDKTFGPICASKSGALDYEANDGDYIIRTFDKDTPAAFKEYTAKVTFGTFEVVGAGFRGGSVPRRVITLLKKGEMPVVVVTPTPTATPSPTATPGVMPLPAPKPSASASPSPSASPKPTGYVIGGKVTGTVKATTLTAVATKVTLKLSTNFQAVVPAAKKGEKITMTIKDPKGKSYTAPVVTVAKAGSVKLPSVKFSVAGKYTITIKVGTKTKTVTLTATK
jgi:uncharacterized membrane protein YgcG